MADSEVVNLDDSDDIAQALAEFQQMPESRRRLLKEKEEDFEKRVKLFDEENPQAGKNSDVLHLNVGGTTNVAAFRRT